MSQSTQLRFIVLALSLAVLAALAGALTWRWYDAHQQPVLHSTILLPQPKVVSDFALLDDQGQAFSRADFAGQWSLLFFGFTSCPDICPNTLFELQQARKLMQQQGTETQWPQVYLVSVDPERDSPQKLAEYLDYFDPSFIGLTGDERQLQAVSFQLGAVYHVQEHEAGDVEYDVDHSASLLLLNPDAQLHAVMRAPHEANMIVNDLRAVIPER